MINLSVDKPIWLLNEDGVRTEFARAVARVRLTYSTFCLNSGSNYAYLAPKKVSAIFESYFVSVDDWDMEKIERALSCTYRGEKLDVSDVDSALARVPESYHQAFRAFLKFVFIVLWGRRVFIAPLAFQAPIHNAEVFDALCRDLDVQTLLAIRAIHPDSGLPSDLKRGEFNNNSSRVTFWQRLLISTDFYSMEDMSLESCQYLFDNAYGEGRKPLRRYYVSDFLLALAYSSDSNKRMVEGIIGGYKQKRESAKLVAKEQRKNSQRMRKSVAEMAIENSRMVIAKVSNGGIPFIFDEMFKMHLVAIRIKRIFDTKYNGAEGGIYDAVHPAVKDFIFEVDGLFRSFLLSKRLQRKGNHLVVLNLFLSYLSCYLPSYLLSRDGGMEDYPKSLKDFNCTSLFTRQHIFSEGFLKYVKAPPITFLKYMELYAEAHGWVNDTLYVRVSIVEDFCDYIQLNRDTFPGAENFSSNFAPSCYPAIQKKIGTVKKIIPREYFAAFLSILYSLEYLVMHINMMAAGEMPGVLAENLYQPSLEELLESHAWSGLMAKEVRGIELVKLDLLNYCPVFYHNGRVQRFEFIPRFYGLMDYEIKGRSVKRVSPNEIRITQLMCETGLRQHHIVWLNKEKYDCLMDRRSNSQLAPLFVSSDKSHGEWTAIVSRHVIDVMRRQEEWYNSCSLPSYSEDMWYSGHEGSRFGKYKPLFRRPGNAKSDSNWKNYAYFPMYMLILQYFINEVLGDDAGDPLVFLKGDGGTKSEIKSYDEKALSAISKDDLTSPHTPHALRAGFVSEAIRFLPPSIIGQFMTGQTEQLVWYYAIFDGKNMPDHQRLLADYLQKNMEALSQGDAPELAQACLDMNARLMASIKTDPVKAIDTHGLISLTGVKETESGIEVLRAKRYTELAFNNCHICPFGNRCPKEVVSKIGVGRPCALCPYAIRGVDHLAAISAEKDKSKEMMVGVIRLIEEYKTRKKSSQNPQALDDLNLEYDRHAREAYALEAIEQQLYKMARRGQLKSFFMQDKSVVVSHYRKVRLDEEEHLIKRLIDVQNFPDVTSPHLDKKFAYMRGALLVRSGRVDELLRYSNHTPAHQLSSQIGGMLSLGALNVKDVFRIAEGSKQLGEIKQPTLEIGPRIGLPNSAEE